MAETSAETLTAFLNPKCTGEAELQALLEQVPVSEVPGFLTEARQRLEALERTFRPLSEYDGESITGPEFPTVTFDSEEHVWQIANAIQTVRRKRTLLDHFELAEPGP